MTKLDVKLFADSPKRRKIELSLDLRKTIKKHFKENKESNKKYTHKDVIDFFQAELGNRIQASTMSEIINNKFNNDDDISKFRNRKDLHPKLEDALFIYYNEKFLIDPKHLPIRDETTIELAKNKFYPMLQITDFKYSISWFNKFKARYGLTSKKLMTSLALLIRMQ